MELNTFIEIAEEKDWSVTKTDDGYSIQRHSPTGKDLDIELEGNNAEELFDSLEEYIGNFDVSQETYIWLDHTGHGTNGAPYEMEDVLEDTKWCLKKMNELSNALNEWWRVYK